MFPSPRANSGDNSSSAWRSRTASSRFKREAFKVLSSAVLYGVWFGASKFNGGRRIPRGSDGTTALTDEMKVAESWAEFLTSLYLFLQISKETSQFLSGTHTGSIARSHYIDWCKLQGTVP